MYIRIILGIAVPFIGTVLGGACVFFMKKEISESVEHIITAFAAGIMTSASFFSLILPGIDYSYRFNNFAFLPVSVGFILGVCSLVVSDAVVFCASKKAEIESARRRKRSRVVFAVAVHNFPEGMAVGAVFASALSIGSFSAASAALALSFGIAVQNFPEGAIISLPLKANGMGKLKAFFASAASGIVEPIGAAVMLVASSQFLPLLPYVLGFAAGAMIFAVVDDMLPGKSDHVGAKSASVAFSVGFVIMMILDVAMK